MKRTAIFAHYDAAGTVKPCTLSYLKALRAHCHSIAFVSNGNLAEHELAKAREYCATAMRRENVGFDFCAWQSALASLDLTDCDELLLANSSVFGPVYPLGPIFEEMSRRECDFWGMTDNFEIAWHLQSYFLVLKRAAFTSECFKTFFRAVLPYRDKDQVIRSYEIGLTRFLEEGGLVPAAFVPMAAWVQSEAGKRKLRARPCNSTLVYPMELLRAGMPLVKVQLLRDNPAKVKLEPVLRAMAEGGYDLAQVEY
jgi:lipopolysaccharide biosynthesis protein